MLSECAQELVHRSVNFVILLFREPGPVDILCLFAEDASVATAREPGVHSRERVPGILCEIVQVGIRNGRRMLLCVDERWRSLLSQAVRINLLLAQTRQLCRQRHPCCRDRKVLPESDVPDKMIGSPTSSPARSPFFAQSLAIGGRVQNTDSQSCPAKRTPPETKRDCPNELNLGRPRVWPGSILPRLTLPLLLSTSKTFYRI